MAHHRYLWLLLPGLLVSGGQQSIAQNMLTVVQIGGVNGSMTQQFGHDQQRADLGSDWDEEHVQRCAGRQPHQPVHPEQRHGRPIRHGLEHLGHGPSWLRQYRAHRADRWDLEHGLRPAVRILNGSTVYQVRP